MSRQAAPEFIDRHHGQTASRMPTAKALHPLVKFAPVGERFDPQCQAVRSYEISSPKACGEFCELIVSTRRTHPDYSSAESAVLCCPVGSNEWQVDGNFHLRGGAIAAKSMNIACGMCL